MQAISHVATALIFKKAVPAAPLFPLILACEAVEFLWVGLNLVGIERTRLDLTFSSVSDVHLLHMPFSHSLATSLALALAAGLVILWRAGRAAAPVAIAISLAVLSHIFLDLLVHAPDIALAPFHDGEKYGTGLYANLPLVSLGIETGWALLCWRIYRGGWALLALIVVLSASSIPFYSTTINMGEASLGGQSTGFAVMILAQMVITSVLVWRLARHRPGARSA